MRDSIADRYCQPRNDERVVTATDRKKRSKNKSVKSGAYHPGRSAR